MFSIIIPTWNNLELAKFCLDAISRHTTVPHEVIFHINDGSDGTQAWAEENHIIHTHSDQNIGICKAVNLAASKAKGDYIVYLNDDMVVLPGWDTVLMNKIYTLNTKAFMLSGTMIEPRESGNKCVITQNYGSSPENFQEEKLLSELGNMTKEDWYGATWPPSVVHREWWNKVGGYSEEFSPGMSSDNDFSMKMWAAGCRIFIGLGQSRVYHFMSKSTQKIIKNDGRKQFLQKYGITQSTFDRHYLKRGQPAKTTTLPEPRKTPGYAWDWVRGKVKLMLMGKSSAQ